jgi:hypothetical protein
LQLNIAGNGIADSPGRPLATSAWVRAGAKRAPIGAVADHSTRGGGKHVDDVQHCYRAIKAAEGKRLTYAQSRAARAA